MVQVRKKPLFSFSLNHLCRKVSTHFLFFFVSWFWFFCDDNAIAKRSRRSTKWKYVRDIKSNSASAVARMRGGQNNARSKMCHGLNFAHFLCACEFLFISKFFFRFLDCLFSFYLYGFHVVSNSFLVAFIKIIIKHFADHIDEKFCVFYTFPN